MSHVWLYNPETEGVWACPEEVVWVFQDVRGWVQCDEPEQDDSHLYDTTPQAPAAKPETVKPHDAANASKEK